MTATFFKECQDIYDANETWSSLNEENQTISGCAISFFLWLTGMNIDDKYFL